MKLESLPNTRRIHNPETFLTIVVPGYSPNLYLHRNPDMRDGPSCWKEVRFAQLYQPRSKTFDRRVIRQGWRSSSRQSLAFFRFSPSISLSPGNLIELRYKGRTLRILVLSEGSEYEGELHKSLKAIARVINRSHRNGLLLSNWDNRKDATEIDSATTEGD